MRKGGKKMEENKKTEWYKDAIVKKVQESNNL